MCHNHLTLDVYGFPLPYDNSICIVLILYIQKMVYLKIELGGCASAE